MKHLQTLRLVNLAMAGFTVLVSLVALAYFAFMATQFPDARTQMIIAAVVLVPIVAVLCVLYVITGNKVARGEGRGLQTVLAVLSLGNCPGILYGLYALWVCYGNPETKAAFERS